MKFTISCELFLRLAHIPLNMPNHVTQDDRKILQCIRLEHKNGHSYAVVGNQAVAAIQHLGVTDEPDGCVHVVIDDQIINQCKQEKVFDSELYVVSIPAIATGSVSSKFGWNYQGNPCMYPDVTPLDHWRHWTPKRIVTETKGAMFWNADYIQLINQTSKSGELVFPEFIDVYQPIIIRDLNDYDWCGIFMGSRRGKIMKPYKMPDWWNEHDMGL